MTVEINENKFNENELIKMNELINLIGNVQIKSFKIMKFKYSLKNEVVLKVNVEQKNLNKDRFTYLVHYNKNNDDLNMYRVRKTRSIRYNPYNRFTTLHEYIQEKNCSKVY